MKKLMLLLMITTCSVSFSQDNESVNDSTIVTKTYSKGDMILNTGISFMGTGAVSWLASRSVAIGIISTGGVITLVGVGVKISEKIKNER